MLRPAVDLRVGGGKDLARIAAGREREARAACSAETERVPRREGLELPVFAAHEHLELVAARRLLVAPAGHEDRVGLGPVGNHGRLLLEREAIALDLHGADARARIAA